MYEWVTPRLHKIVIAKFKCVCVYGRDRTITYAMKWEAENIPVC